jgi:AraC family transcriptional regulator of adaptative response / DNA-3-methyladenine glycosylase II
MHLDADTCYRALQSRDARFDGRFFVAVSSTHIYCRPVCTVRVPKRENCAFFRSAAAAEAAGYRPCLRCRPELAPGNGSIDAVSRTAHAAARLIEDGSVSDTGLALVARRLGITDRHLRRVFQSEFGVAPIAFAQTQRLLLAKRLLTDTRLPVTDVAFASGFSSVRRFNAVFKTRYRLNPTALRKSVSSSLPADAPRFELSFRPPYDWAALLAFLRGRTIAGVEAIEGVTYRRTVRIENGGQSHAGWIAIAPVEQRATLALTVSPSLVKVLPAVLGRSKDLTDLSCHPSDIAAVLGPLAARNPGLRVPGAFDGFETAVRAVLGQQITVAAARTLAGRFAAAFGDAIETPFAALAAVFPAPHRIADVHPSHISKHGVTAARARSIVALARGVADGQLILSPSANVEETIEALRALPGIGEWTAQYIAMRALAWPDAYPHTDFGVMKALGETNARRALAAGEAWRPWRAYAVMHLWNSLK